jgi:hypothetical protein
MTKKSKLKMMTFTLLSLSITLVTLIQLCIAQQPLEAAQYFALMAVYDAIGCNSATCARFTSAETCTGATVVCQNGRVTQMCGDRRLAISFGAIF